MVWCAVMKRNNKQFYIYGRKPVQEIVSEHPDKVLKVSIIKGAKRDESAFVPLMKIMKENRIAYDYIDKRTAERYVGDVNTQGVIALLSGFVYHDLQDFLGGLKEDFAGSVLVLTGIEDTHNFGAILRSAAAVGVSAVIIASKNQVPVNGTVFKTSAGTAGKVPVIRVSNINDTMRKLKDANFWTYAVDMIDGGQWNIWGQKLDGRVAIVLGSEGKGIPQKTLEISDFVIPIPMENGVESLNVSVAAAIALYEWKRQQQG